MPSSHMCHIAPRSAHVAHAPYAACRIDINADVCEATLAVTVAAHDAHGRAAFFTSTKAVSPPERNPSGRGAKGADRSAFAELAMLELDKEHLMVWQAATWDAL